MKKSIKRLIQSLYHSLKTVETQIGEPFIYCLDSPKSNEEINSPFVLIQGWIISAKEKTISQPKICNSASLAHPLRTISRPDVESAYSHHCVLGFQQYLSIIELSLKTDWSIQFFIGNQQYSFPLNFKVSEKAFESFSMRKKDKINKIRGILSCPLCRSEQIEHKDNILECSKCEERFSVSEVSYNFLTPRLIEQGAVKSTGNVSANNYDAIAIKLIEQFSNGLILDNGCGLRSVYYDNVINFEIVDYPTTDVLGIGEKLPFKSDSFDAVFSLAVLEHVKNPFECAQEIIRILKPGGILYAAVPFLQPFHGYPDHYYNMTSSGLKNLFSEKVQVIECSVPLSGLPIWCLSWFLNSYIRGLPEETAEKFKQMRVADLIDNPRNYFEKDFVKELSSEVNEELACVNALIARKKE